MYANQRTNELLSNFQTAGGAGLDLSKQKVAVFGLGDSASYGDYFCDAMEEVRKIKVLQQTATFSSYVTCS